MTTTSTSDYEVDNRWRREWAPVWAPASYGARWISMDSARVGDILRDRQGFGYDRSSNRDTLMRALEALHLHRPTPFWYSDEPADVTDRAMMRVQHGQDESGLWASGVSHAWNMEFHMEARDGYIYVEAWLHA